MVQNNKLYQIGIYIIRFFFHNTCFKNVFLSKNVSVKGYNTCKIKIKSSTKTLLLVRME